MSQMYGNVEPPEETNENFYEDCGNHTASSGTTRQDDVCKKNSEKKYRKISFCDIALTIALISTFGLAACGMILVVQNNFRIQRLMEEMEMKMITMKDHIREIENKTNLIRIYHEDFSSYVKDSIDTMQLTLRHIESLEYPIAVRLFGGNSTQRSGRVEIRYNGIWGTICDDYWGQKESNVVCHMLGFGNASSYHNEAYFGEGNGNIWLDDVQCTGIESDITYCLHVGWGNNNCGHSEDVSVVCENVPVPTVSVEEENYLLWTTV